jgi:hypothetical protein
MSLALYLIMLLYRKKLSAHCPSLICVYSSEILDVCFERYSFTRQSFAFYILHTVQNRDKTQIQDYLGVLGLILQEMVLESTFVRPVQRPIYYLRFQEPEIAANGG